MNEQKTSLRQTIRTAKKAVPFREKLTRSRHILAQVEKLTLFRNANIVLLYWSMDDEVQTHEFVEKWFREKTILLPCVDGDKLRLRQYTGPDSMHTGEQFGIAEPTGEEFTDLDKINVIIVPGVAFDREGHRMGRGRGFYDRLLKSTPNAYKIGVAFDFQMVESVPVEPHDVTMDKVIND